MKDQLVSAPRCPHPPTALRRKHKPRSVRVGPWCLALLLVPLGCAHFPRRGPVAQDVIIARQLAQQGMDALHKGSIQQAESKFNQAIEHCPSNTTARYQLANCLWQRGAHEEAISQLSEALEMSGRDDVEMIVELGYMQANVGRLDDALSMAEQAIRVSPEYPLAWQLRGDVFRRQSEWSNALASYHRALTYEGTNPEVQLSVAEVYHQLDRPARVLATLHRLEDQLAPERQPERMLVLKSLALQQLERPEEAVQVLARAKVDRQLSPGAQVQLAHAQVAAGRYGEAQITINAVLPIVGASEQASLRQLKASMAERRVRGGPTTLR